MITIGMNTARASSGLAVVSALLLSCSLDKLPEAPDNASPESAQALVVTRSLALDVLQAAMLNTVEALGHDRFPPAQLVIRDDYEPPPGRDLLRERELNSSKVARQLATRVGYQTRSGDGAISCLDDPGPEVIHPCKLAFEGAFYTPVITRLSETHATVSVNFKTRPGNAAGIRTVELEFGAEGWTVVKVDNLAW